MACIIGANFERTLRYNWGCLLRWLIDIMHSASEGRRFLSLAYVGFEMRKVAISCGRQDTLATISPQISLFFFIQHFNLIYFPSLNILRVNSHGISSLILLGLFHGYSHKINFKIYSILARVYFYALRTIKRGSFDDVWLCK